MSDIKEKEIVVIGVSGVPEKYGFKIFRDLLKSGYRVSGINPKDGEVLGEKIYKNLAELKKVPDIVITVIPPKITEKAVDECIEIGVKEIWMQPGSESEAAFKKAKGLGINIFKACFMVSHGIW